MTVQLIMDNVVIPVKKIQFSDGSSNVKLAIPEGFIPSGYLALTVDPTTPADNYLWDIALVSDALLETFKAIDLDELKWYINLPYLPHARADRVFEKGNSFPLKLFFEALMSLFHDNPKLTLTDPHSDFYKRYEGYFDIEVFPQHKCFLLTVKDVQSGDVLVSPDKGAIPKIEKLHTRLHNRTIATTLIEAGKKRDPSTGKILETTLPNVDLTGKRCIIVDDILDGGGTFIPLAEKLKEAGASSVELYITHGIFAKGLNIFKGIIDKFHVYGIVGTYVTMQDVHNFNNGKDVK